MPINLFFDKGLVGHCVPGCGNLTLTRFHQSRLGHAERLARGIGDALLSAIAKEIAQIFEYCYSFLIEGSFYQVDEVFASIEKFE